MMKLSLQGVYRLSPEGTLTLLTKELRAPNGVGFSPDKKTLYLSNADREHAVWMAFGVFEDGTLGPGRVFFDATEWARAGKKGVPDGLDVDRNADTAIYRVRTSTKGQEGLPIQRASKTRS